MIYCKKCGNELSDDSVFCNKCGSKMIEDTGKSFVTKVKSLNKKFLTIGFIGVLIVAVVILATVFLNNPIGKFKKAIEDNNYTEASKLYNENIKGKASEEMEVINFLKSDIENIKKGFIENKLEYNLAISQLDTIDKLELISTEIISIKNEINKLNDSRTAYKKGEEFLNSKNHKDALSELKKVIKEDGNYNKAQELINNSTQDYKTTILSESETAAKSLDYDKALTLLSEALVLIPNDPDISDKKSSYEKLNDEKKIAERKKKLEETKLNQQIVVEKTNVAVQDDRYKTLYPDMMQAIIRNNSDKTVKNMKVSFLAFDKNNLPIKIKTQFGSSSASFEFIGNGDNVNIVPKSSFGNDVGWKLDEAHGIKTLLACVKEVEFYDGSKLINPYYEYWIEEYKEKPLH